jgi:hypothetical protein
MTVFPHGSYRRRIRVVNTEEGVVAGGLEDDFHHFTVTLRHDGERVTAAEGGTRRSPWTTCADARAPLRAIEGMALSPRCLSVGEHTDPRANCTHMFDLAGLAVAHAARGGAVGAARQYDVQIPYAAQIQGGEQTVRCWRDGQLALSWVLDGRRCVSPPPFSETQWRGGFLRWADATLPVEDAEAAIVLRRACDIGMGRGVDLDAVERADELGPLMEGICYTMSAPQLTVALRNKGTIRDFDGNTDALLDDGP